MTAAVRDCLGQKGQSHTILKKLPESHIKGTLHRERATKIKKISVCRDSFSAMYPKFIAQMKIKITKSIIRTLLFVTAD